MIEFVKFPSILNTYNINTINRIKQMGKYVLPWVATVKAHGSNMALNTDGVDFAYSSRTELMPKTPVSGLIGVAERYRQDVINLRDVISRYRDINQLTIHGELIGGAYPHPDVPRDSNATKVQKGVYYTPHNDFYAFGISIDGVYQNFTFFQRVIRDIGCPHSVVISVGDLGHCLSLSNEFQDPIHKIFGLPEIEDNIAEGLVIQPMVPFFFGNGKMALLKNKSPRWKEKANKPKRVRVEKIIPVEVREQIEEISKYITTNKLLNVLSHHGTIGEKDFGLILGRYSKDVLCGYLEDNQDVYDVLSKVDQKTVRGKAQKMCAELLREKFIKLVKVV